MEKFIKFLKIEKFHIKFLSFIAVAIIVSSNILSYLNTRDLIDSGREVTKTASNIEVLETLSHSLDDAQTGRDFYFITGDKSNLEPYEKTTSQIDTIYSKLKAAIADKKNQSVYFDSLTMLVRERFQVMNKSIELQDNHGSGSRMVKTLLSDGKIIQDKIAHLIMRMKLEERRLLKEKMDEANSRANFTLISITGGTFFSIILLIIAFTLLDKGNRHNLFETSSGVMTPEELETIVRERTEEISKINRKLYAEIDKEKLLLEAIRKSELEYRMLFEQAHDAIMIFRPEDEIVLEVNERACEIYKLSKSDFVGLSLKTISKNIPEGVQHIKNTLEKGFFYNFQTVHYNKAGTEMLMEINAAVINYRGKRAILSINRDITDRVLSYIPLPGS